jgi:hypothetical protein
MAQTRPPEIQTGAPTMGSILLEADGLVNGDRAKAYGPVEKNWGRTVEIFKAMTGIALTVDDALMFMVAVKLAREANLKRRDNSVDACGYLELRRRVLDGRA